ncbi:MAG: DUF349 domain-containing protein [Brumimicrobium sp.]|nr:DUF349 domain-containing protein [Brumimicrobium sp.]
MENNEYILRLKELTDQEDLISIGREVSELRSQFEDYLLEETRKFQIAQLEAEEKGLAFDQEDWITPLKEAFYEIYSPFKDKRKALIDAKRNEEQENLSKKKALINRLREIIQNEENIGAAFGAHKEINESWKKIGDIPRDKRHDIQQEYSRLLEEFFYNMNIYKEIKEYDFKKNYDAKKQIISQLKALENEQIIKEIESSLKSLQNAWEDIGPTKQELWEELKEEYWQAIKSLYDKIRSHYDERREQFRENLILKEKLLENAKDILEKNRESVKDWNQQTDEIIQIQKKWKEIGPGPRKENKTIWKEFRKVCDAFFDAKSDFFKEAQSEFNEIADKKKELIREVDAIKSNTDWDQTAQKIIGIQKKWKKLGNAGQKNEQRLWKEFRKACDHFFEARKAHVASLEEEFKVNLEKKKELVASLEALVLPDDKKSAIKELKAFSTNFAAIGFVPADEKDTIYKAFKSALDKHYTSLNLQGEEKEKVLFQARLDTMKGSDQADRLFEKEKDAIRNEINQIKQQVIQYENNLGFFANSKGANKLRDQVLANIEKEKEKIEALKTRLKMIPNE